MKPDFSFIRLRPTLEEALRLGDPKVSRLNYHDAIQLLPDQIYLQKTNLSSGFEPPGDLSIFVMGCNGYILSDVTANVAVSFFTDRYGLQQADIEYISLGVDYHFRPVVFNFRSGSSNWYSNPVLITAEGEEAVTRIDYWAVGYFHNIDYGNSPLKQSIGLRCYYHEDAPEDTAKEYVQTNDNKITANVRLGKEKVYRFDHMNPFVRERARVALAHDVIYIDGVRCTNKPGLKNGERKGSSNLSDASFTAVLNENDTYTAGVQNFPAFDVIDRFPLPGTYTADNFVSNGGNLMFLQFNRAIGDVPSGFNVKLYKDGVLSVTVPYSGLGTDGISFMEITGDLLQINFNDQIFYDTGTATPNNGTYDVVVPPLRDGYDIEWEGYVAAEWRVILSNPDWLAADWNGADWFTGE